MEVCANCGHQLGVGRFCTNCGMRVDHQPPVSGSPTLPPPAVEPPPQARYPLFADDVADPAPTGTPAPPRATPSAPHPVSRPTTPAPGPPRRAPSGWLPWAVGSVALLLVAMIGALLLLGDDEETGGAGATASDRGDTTTTEPSAPATSQKPPKLPQPSDDSPSGDGPLDLARYAVVEVPETAPPNVDVSGNQVRYVAENMLDGVPSTCWRMPGSGAGEEIVFSFREPVQLTEVGIVNGYAKTSGDLDWYTGNRRVLDVEWSFDDGSSVEQELDSTRDLQAVPIEPVTTTTVTLRLVEVSEPGRGRSARNYTAISDVSLVGEPG